MKPSIQPTKGFRDLYPDDMAIQNWLYGHMRQTARLFGYQEYEGPLVESLDLYAAKSSRELVEKQTFQIKDRGGRTLSLRPEMTPSLARMIAAKQQALGSPLRWFNIGYRFRYEAPQRGRSRQFTQWDVDLIGNATPESDAEILAVAATFLKTLGFNAQEVVIKVNNRRLMEHKASLIDIPKGRINDLFQMIDKRDKMPENEWVTYLKDQGLTGAQITNLQSILADRDISFESEELTATFSSLKDMGLAEYVQFDPGIVRGLDYYTGTVFEARDRAGKFRALIGGGRYDNLIELFGGTPLSGIGFACGDMVVLEMLKEYGKLPSLDKIQSKPDVFVTIFNNATLRDALKVSTVLRESGIPTELYTDSTIKIDRQLKYADKKGIQFAIIIGPDEVSRQEVMIKDLKSRTQKNISQNDITSYVSAQISSQ